MNPKKLIRKYITEKLKKDEWETITDQNELNRLYAIKVREELAEIQESDHKDIMEFVDLIQVAWAFVKQNGFTEKQIHEALFQKNEDKGTFGRLALNNLNPANPSNKLYFETSESGKGWDDIFLEYSKACSLELEAVKYILPLKDWLNKNYPQKSESGRVLQADAAEQPYNLEDSIKKASENRRDIDPDKFLSEIRG